MTTQADDAKQEQERVRDLLTQVIDPEVGVNIVDLGLVYRIESLPEHILIEMTMTSPACPMGEMIMDDVEAALTRGIPETRDIRVHLVWEPPWTPAMMSADSKQHFGWRS
ncbi:metal-sulfur cluster assembly factor [Chitinivorax sp. PXF-14]|uniref:metal-sulfur cluster assembly factor n=1 Tax=Chitinivorax sp. PXF-14 TaxID=3230488 RepID=UPI0034652851